MPGIPAEPPTTSSRPNGWLGPSHLPITAPSRGGARTRSVGETTGGDFVLITIRASDSATRSLNARPAWPKAAGHDTLA